MLEGLICYCVFIFKHFSLLELIGKKLFSFSVVFLAILTYYFSALPKYSI